MTNDSRSIWSHVLLLAESLYPFLHEHVYEPISFLQLCSHPCKFSEHSLMSTNRQARCISKSLLCVAIKVLLRNWTSGYFFIQLPSNWQPYSKFIIGRCDIDSGRRRYPAIEIVCVHQHRKQPMYDVIVDDKTTKNYICNNKKSNYFCG